MPISCPTVFCIEMSRKPGDHRPTLPTFTVKLRLEMGVIVGVVVIRVGVSLGLDFGLGLVFELGLGSV